MKFEFLTLGYEPCPEGETPERFGFECPTKKDGSMCTGLLIRRPDLGRNVPSWEWNGDRERPTFQPSINCQDCWHGFITNGEAK